MKRGCRRICLSLLAALCWLTAAAQRDSLAYRLTPFVKGGLTVGLLDDMGMGEGHTGFHLNAGVRIPFQRGDHYEACLVPSLKYITKGEVWDHYYERLFLNMNFVELPIDVAYHYRQKNWQMLIGGGGFVGYGVGGRLTGSDHLYNFHGYRLKDRPRTFGPEVGARRWDYGLRLLYEFQYKHFIFSADIEKGFPVLVPKRFFSDRKLTTVAISLGIGYAL